MTNSAMLFPLDLIEAVPTLSLMRGTYDLRLIMILFHLVPKMETDDGKLEGVYW
jgi:hypothetical protein